MHFDNGTHERCGFAMSKLHNCIKVKAFHRSNGMKVSLLDDTVSMIRNKMCYQTGCISWSIFLSTNHYYDTNTGFC